MKKIATFALAATVGILIAAPAQSITGKSKYEMIVNSNKENLLQWVEEGGRSGQCFKLSLPADSKNNITFHSRNQIKVESSSDKVKVTMWMKGKGSGFFGFLCYKLDKKIFYPKTMSKFSLDSAKWKKLEFEYTPVPGSLYANNIGFALPAISLAPGSEIFVDDITLEFIGQNKNIQIEE